MDLKDILSISGYGGLFRFVSQGRNGVIVEGLVDKKRMNANSTLRISGLEDIAVFTDDKEVQLKEVFRLIFRKEDGGSAIDPKLSNDKLKKYFEEILPNYDKEKVYVSDIKKIFSWYNLLLTEKLIDLEEDKVETTEEKPVEETKVIEDDTKKVKEKKEKPAAKAKETKKKK
jgi:hypothetical protein